MKKQPTQEQANSALECILGQKTVGFYPVIAKALGSAPAAIMVSQAFFWQYKAKFGSQIVIDGEQYFSKTVAEWYEETSISESAQRLARSILVKHGIMIEKLAGLPASMHFRVDINALVAVINGYLTTGITVAAKHGNKERELTRTGSGKFRRQEAAKDGYILNVETSESFESEGERTPTAPNHSTSKEEKKENGFAPNREKSTADIIFETAALYGIEVEALEAETPPSKKVAPKKDSPGDCPDCLGTGTVNDEFCFYCGGSGSFTENSGLTTTREFEVTAIASPTDLPGVTLVEAAQKFRGPLQPHEYPNPGSPADLEKEMMYFANGNTENWRDGVLERGGARDWPQEKIKKCLSEFCDWQFKTDFTKGRMSQYTAGFSLWLKRQPRFEANGPGNNGATRGGQSQQPAILTPSQYRKLS